jgi:hypothetical protein
MGAGTLRRHGYLLQECYSIVGGGHPPTQLHVKGEGREEIPLRIIATRKQHSSINPQRQRKALDWNLPAAKW